MLQNRLGTRTKTSQTRVFCVFAVYLSLYQAVNFPKMIDGISLRFRFDRPFERPFRNQFSELAPGPQHSVQKIPSNGMQNLPNISAVTIFLARVVRLRLDTRMCSCLHHCKKNVCKKMSVRLAISKVFCQILPQRPNKGTILFLNKTLKKKSPYQIWVFEGVFFIWRFFPKSFQTSTRRASLNFHKFQHVFSYFASTCYLP